MGFRIGSDSTGRLAGLRWAVSRLAGFARGVEKGRLLTASHISNYNRQVTARSGVHQVKLAAPAWS